MEASSWGIGIAFCANAAEHQVVEPYATVIVKADDLAVQHRVLLPSQ